MTGLQRKIQLALKWRFREVFTCAKQTLLVETKMHASPFFHTFLDLHFQVCL